MTYKETVWTALAYDTIVICAFTYLTVRFDRWWIVLLALLFVIGPDRDEDE